MIRIRIYFLKVRTKLGCVLNLNKYGRKFSTTDSFDKSLLNVYGNFSIMFFVLLQRVLDPSTSTSNWKSLHG